MTRLFACKLLLSVVAMLLSAGSSADSRKTLPKQRPPHAIAILDSSLSNWSKDSPNGMYRVPDSQIFISGQQAVGMGSFAVSMIGGVLLENSYGREAGKDAVRGSEQALRINISEEARVLVREELSSGEFSGKLVEATADSMPLLKVTPGVVLTFVNDTDLRPFVVLKAHIDDNNTKTKHWTARYYASSQLARPLGGDGGWTANNGADLRAVVSADLKRAVSYMLDDIASPVRRDKTKLTAVEAHFPYMKARFKTVGYLLGEDDAFIYYVPNVSEQQVLSGVSILSKETATYRPAAKGDPTMEAVEVAKPKKVWGKPNPDAKKRKY